MIRLVKPARSKERGRGLFSYLTESVINVINFLHINGNQEIKYYHNLFDIPGYVKENLFDVSFNQDTKDYEDNKHLYQNIELTNNNLKLDCYEPIRFTNEIRIISEKIINNFFIPNDNLNNLFNSRHSEINFEKTIGVHRRATDIGEHHQLIDLKTLFYNIEQEEFENIFLMCDNSIDMENFKNRYGNKIITFDEFTSSNHKLPFFRTINESSQIESHILELVFGVFTLGKTKKFICTKSNLSSFTILTNSNLNYKLLF